MQVARGCVAKGHTWLAARIILARLGLRKFATSCAGQPVFRVVVFVFTFGALQPHVCSKAEPQGSCGAAPHKITQTKTGALHIVSPSVIVTLANIACTTNVLLP